MIIMNEIPILEFDTDNTAVIMPTHERLDLKLPKKAVFAFLGKHIDKYAKKHCWMVRSGTPDCSASSRWERPELYSCGSTFVN